MPYGWDAIKRLLGDAKIDNKAVNGLNLTAGGVANSLAYKVHEIEKHFHNSEYWYGDGGSNDFADNLTEWVIQAAGSANVYGTEELIHSGADLGIGAKLDVHRILVTAATASKVYKFKLHYGTGTFAASTFLTEVVGFFPATGKSGPIEMICPRIDYTNKIWAVVKCEQASQNFTFLIGAHGYVG